MNGLNSAWAKTLELISPDIPKPSFDAWVKNSQPIAVHDDLIIIAVPNNFAKKYMEGKVAERLANILGGMLRRDIGLDFVVPPDAAEAEEEVALTTAHPVAGTVTASERNEPLSAYQPLNPRYIFNTFVVGTSNRLAHAAAMAVTENPARAYNPLFIYGGVGLGKTHLMHAIAHQILLRNPYQRVVYVSSETFTNELINAIRDGRQLQFRGRYRNVDCLLIDDVQFIGGKETTQEEFFHTFNTLHEARRQIVISSDRPPKNIPTLESRLLSRFEWGLIADIQPPDLETRHAILRKKADLEDIEVPDDVLQYIAKRVDTNIRELEGALIRLIAFVSFHHEELSPSLAEQVLEDVLPKRNKQPITISLIQEVVAEYYGLHPNDFSLRKRTRSIAFPRQVAMFLVRKLTDNSLPRIGQEFGGRDHTTVMHACEKISRGIAEDPEFASTIDALKKKIVG